MKKIMKFFVILLTIFLLSYSTIIYATDGTNIEMNITGDTTIQANQNTLVLTISLGNFTNIESGKVLGFEGILNCTDGVFKNITAKGQNGWTIEYRSTTKKIIGDTDSATPNTTIGTITFELNDNIDVTNPKIEFSNILLTDGTNDFTINKTFNLTFEDANTQQESNNSNSGTGQQQEEQTQTQTQEQQATTTTSSSTAKKTTTSTTQTSSSTKSTEQNNTSSQLTSTNKNTTSNTGSNSSTTTKTSSSANSSTTSSSENLTLPKTGLKNPLIISIVILIALAIILKVELKRTKF